MQPSHEPTWLAELNIYIIIVICVSRPKSASFSSESGFSSRGEPRLENRRAQKALFGRGAH
jgi:hypothetical protein